MSKASGKKGENGDQPFKNSSIADFKDEYLTSKSDIDEFVTGYGMCETVHDNFYLGIVSSTIIGAVSVMALREFTSYSFNSLKAIFAVVLIYTIGYFVVYRALVIRLNNDQIDKRSVLYHYIALSLDEYENSNYEETYRAIKKASDWINKSSIKQLNYRHEEVLQAYVNSLEQVSNQERDGIIEDTFDSSISKVADQIQMIEQSEFKEIIGEPNGNDSKSRYHFLLNALLDLGNFGPLKGIAPFLGVTALGLTIFYLVDNQLGMFSIVALTPPVQYIVNRDRSE